MTMKMKKKRRKMMMGVPNNIYTSYIAADSFPEETHQGGDCGALGIIVRSYSFCIVGILHALHRSALPYLEGARASAHLSRDVSVYLSYLLTMTRLKLGSQGGRPVGQSGQSSSSSARVLVFRCLFGCYCWGACAALHPNCSTPLGTT